MNLLCLTSSFALMKIAGFAIWRLAFYNNFLTQLVTLSRRTLTIATVLPKVPFWVCAECTPQSCLDSPRVMARSIPCSKLLSGWPELGEETIDRYKIKIKNECFDWFKNVKTFLKVKIDVEVTADIQINEYLEKVKSMYGLLFHVP